MFGIEAQKIAGAVLFALVLTWGARIVAEHVIPPLSQPEPGAATTTAANTHGKPGAPQQAAAPAAPFEQLLASADPKAGQAVTKKCASCHTFDPGGGAKVGPSLAGVFGRKVASVEGFQYSPALQQFGGSWTADKLNSFLTKPGQAAPGTKMTFAGLSDPKERAEVIAYLHSISPGAPPLAAPQTAGQ
jgi:cytochrome c